MSRSCFRTAFSRRSRFNSACRSTGASLGSLTSRSCLSHRVSVDKPMPRSSAISRRVRPLVSASRTASRRNSGVGLFPFPIEHLLVPQLVLSTFSGQVQDSPDGAECLRQAGKSGVDLWAAVSANAEAFATDLAPVLTDARAAGRVTLRGIASELKARWNRTRRGGVWQVSKVKHLLERDSIAKPLLFGSRPQTGRCHHSRRVARPFRCPNESSGWGNRDWFTFV